MPIQPSPRWRVPVLCLALAAMTFAVFGQTVRHDFVNYDDGDYVFRNPMVARGLTRKGAVWAFAQPHAGNWHPLTWLSHMLDCQLYGLNPWGHHLSNVLLHTATVLALFLVLLQMTGFLWRSAFVAAVFAIHPLRVESVAWVAERKDVLSGLFFMLAIGAYVRFARHPWSPARYGLVVLLFALGLMCKPMLVTLPLVLLLLDYWPLHRMESAKRLVLEKLPLLALSAASCVATLLAQHEGIQSAGTFTLLRRMGHALTACMVYLGQMVWPTRLAVLYPFPHNGLPPQEVALAGMVLASLSALAWGGRRTRPWLLVGWFWYLVMLLPVVGVIQVGQQAHADRYTYLPQIGIYVAVTWLVAEWRVSRVALGGLMTGVAAVLMVCAWQQTAHWQDSETLWTRALSCTTGNDVAHFGMGDVFDKKKKLDDAVAQYQLALQINPNYADAHNNLGLDLGRKGKVGEAITQYQMALQIMPSNASARYNLGVALMQERRLDEAITQYQMALQITPDDADAHFNLGLALLEKHRAAEAITYFRQALQIKPDFAEAHKSLGNALLQTGHTDEAITQYQVALQIKPADAEEHYDLGIALEQKGRAAEAISQYQEAVQREPANAKVQNNLAWLLATCADASLRNGAKAVELAQQANGLSGGADPVILDTLAAALAEAGRFGDATRTAQKALELARAAGQQDLVKELNGELKLYEAGLPCRQ